MMRHGCGGCGVVGWAPRSCSRAAAAAAAADARVGFPSRPRPRPLSLSLSLRADGCNADLALSWIRSTYLSLSRLPSKQIYVHVTNATDTKGIDFVWQAARKIIINQNLQNLRLV